MNIAADTEIFRQWLLAGQHWLQDNVLSLAASVQLATVLLFCVCAWMLRRVIEPRVVASIDARVPDGRFRVFAKLLVSLSGALAATLIVAVSVVAARQMGFPNELLRVAANLLLAWVAIRIMSALVRDPSWSRAIAVFAWAVAALNILNVLDGTIAILDDLALTFGRVRISILTVIQGMLILGLLLWVANVTANLMERRIQASPRLTPSLRVLLVKLFNTTIFTLAIVTALSSVGIDLTAFAVFSGALGVGIGFGLQKVISNLLSGVVLLLDKSVKPGDVIEVGNTYGWVASLGARYASVVTRDGAEYLIPNEDLITHQVVNYSYSNSLLRLRVPVGISYRSDVRTAMQLMVNAALSVGRILPDPAPVCLIVELGESALKLELRMWISDPGNGLANVRSEVMLKTLDLFKQHGILISFPQLDLHFTQTSSPNEGGYQDATTSKSA